MHNGELQRKKTIAKRMQGFRLRGAGIRIQMAGTCVCAYNK